MGMIKRKKCRNCKGLFVPDARNKWHQTFCSKPECRKASKAHSQAKWLQKPQNQDYFRGPVHVKRVQQWRGAHPGYWRRHANVSGTLQDPLIVQPADIHKEKGHFGAAALQDLLNRQDPVLIGFISKFADIVLQDDMAITIRRLQQLGTDIMNPSHKGGRHDCQVSNHRSTAAHGAQTVQLDRPSPGA